MGIKIVVDSLEEFCWINHVLNTGCINTTKNLKEYFKENDINTVQECDFYSSENFTIGEKIKERYSQDDINKLSNRKAKVMEMQG